MTVAFSRLCAPSVRRLVESVPIVQLAAVSFFSWSQGRPPAPERRTDRTAGATDR